MEYPIHEKNPKTKNMIIFFDNLIAKLREYEQKIVKILKELYIKRKEEEERDREKQIEGFKGSGQRTERKRRTKKQKAADSVFKVQIGLKEKEEEHKQKDEKAYEDLKIKNCKYSEGNQR